MTATARKTAITVLSASVMTAVALASAIFVGAAAGSEQRCVSGSDCVIGEFVYDDEYVPVTGATCTLTSRYPDGSLFLNSQAMTGNSDGWYGYTLSTPSTLGYYRTQVCCTAGTDYMCLDKSFEAVETESAPAASEVAQAVWGYSSRTMTGFGTLVSDIWGHSSRDVTNLGTVVRDVWSHATRSLTSESTTSGDLTEIEKTVKENRLLLERLVNQPIIQNFIEEEEIDLEAQVRESKQQVEGMYMDTQVAVSQMGVVMLAWEEKTAEEVVETVEGVAAKVGQEVDTAGTATVMGRAAWLGEKWGWVEVEEVEKQAKVARGALEQVRRKLLGVGGWEAAYVQGKAALGALESLERLVGGVEDGKEEKTVYGRLTQVTGMARALSQRAGEADELLSGWDGRVAVARQEKIEKLQREVLEINRVPAGQEALRPKFNIDDVGKRLRNRVLAIRGLIEANRAYLARGEEKTLARTWLEEGSMVFKSLITNPSKLIGQEVEVKYYLPAEVREEDIIGTDEGLTAKFDAEKDQMYVEGKFLLKVGESRAVAVRTADVWDLSGSEIESMRQQAEELARPLSGTAFFAQGVTLTADINVALDKVQALWESAVTPEQKIRKHREARLELAGVVVKMEKLKELVTEVSSSKTLLGFVGGVQVVAVWGLVIILVTGFTFLALYMKMIWGGRRRGRGEGEGRKGKTREKGEKHNPGRGQVGGWRIAVAAVVAAVVAAATTGVMVRRMMLVQVEAKETANAVVAEETVEEGKLVEAREVEAEEGGQLAVGGPEILGVVVWGEYVNLREGPGLEYEVKVKIRQPEEVVKLSQEGEWVEVEREDGMVGWVARKFLEGGQKAADR